MFKQRLITLLLLGPLVLCGIYFVNQWVFTSIVVVLVLAGGWEWSQLIPISHWIKKLIFLVVLLIFIGLAVQWFDYWLTIGLLFWGLILWAVLTFPASQEVWGNRYIVGGSCLLLLPLFVSVVNAIYQRSHGNSLIIYIICLIWAADIGAYVVGKRFGHHKLIPQVSPGKTIEGTLGGFWLAMIVAIIGYFCFKPHSIFLWYVSAAFTILISVLGDLSISMLKRRSKLKDTGSIFPGHGGVLDRMDSLLAALPLFYCGIVLVGL